MNHRSTLINSGEYPRSTILEDSFSFTIFSPLFFYSSFLVVNVFSTFLILHLGFHLSFFSKQEIPSVIIYELMKKKKGKEKGKEMRKRCNEICRCAEERELGNKKQMRISSSTP